MIPHFQKLLALIEESFAFILTPEVRGAERVILMLRALELVEGLSTKDKEALKNWIAEADGGLWEIELTRKQLHEGRQQYTFTVVNPIGGLPFDRDLEPIVLDD